MMSVVTLTRLIEPVTEELGMQKIYDIQSQHKYLSKIVIPTE